MKRQRTKTADTNEGRVACAVIAGMFLALVITSSVAERVNTRILTEHVMRVLSEYTQGASSKIAVDVKMAQEKAMGALSLMQYGTKEEVCAYLQKSMMSSNSIIYNMGVIRLERDGFLACVSAIPKMNEDVSARYRPFVIVPAASDMHPLRALHPYVEKLGLSTVIPYIIQGSSKRDFAFFEINAIALLRSMGGPRQAAPAVVSLYSTDGILLETTSNVKKRLIATPLDDGVFGLFNTYNNALGLFARKEKDAIYMMKVDYDSALCVAVKIPTGFIAQSALSIRLSIFIVALMSTVAMATALFNIIKIARKKQSLLLMQSEARFSALQGKMSPHLLFNTLDSVVYSIEEGKPSDALSCIKSLSFILRTDLRDSGTEITMTRQVRYIKSYVELQKIRYAKSFLFKLDIDLGAYDSDSLMILKFCVQPLVENCFVHSVYRGYPFTVISVFYKVTDKVAVTVEDDGEGISNEKRNEILETLETKESAAPSHIGIRSINERIKLRYGDEYGIEIPQVKSGFCAIVRLPVITA